jgi:hypothetical protein
VCHGGGIGDEVTIEEDGPLLLIGVNRPDAHNLWNLELIQAVCRACKRLADVEGRPRQRSCTGRPALGPGHRNRPADSRERSARGAGRVRVSARR